MSKDKTISTGLSATENDEKSCSFFEKSKSLLLLLLLLFTSVVDVVVVDGKFTPVQVTLIPAGTSSVQRKEQRVGMKAGGFGGRKTKVIDDDSVTYQISVVAAAPLPYQAKQPQL